MFHGGWFSYFSSASGERPKISWALLRRVLAYARPYRFKITGMLVLILASTGLGLISPLIMRQLIDVVIPQGDLNQLLQLALALLLIPLLNGGISILQRRWNAEVGEGVIYDLRVALYARLQRMSLRFFTNTRLGELMSRLNSDVVGAQSAISNTIVGIVTNLVQATAISLVMLGLEWRLTIAGVLILPAFVLIARRMGRRLRDIARLAMDLNAQMNAMMNETLNIGGALLVKLFGRNALEVERFQNRAGKVREIGVQRAVLSTSFFVTIGLVSAVSTAFIYGLGGYLVIQQVFTVGTIVAFGSYLAGLYSALQSLANAPVEFVTSMVSFERVFEVIDLPAEIEDRPGAITLENVAGELVFEDVSFQYDPRDQNLLSEVERYGQLDRVQAVFSGGEVARRTEAGSIPVGEKPPGGEVASQAPADIAGETGQSQARVQTLEQISFRVKPGQLVALVGPSGAGKTTLTYLIPRLYDPSAGRILLDGHDLRDVTLESLSAQMGMVTQETYLFHDTIRTNLLYARLQATQEELEAACQAANIHEFIMELPDGYDTIVGERGYRLSGGEKQRLALARVILKNPRILLLDEATSHLDSESEMLIQEALKRVMAGRTSIVIAHRLSTILAADQILVLDRGRIVEQGRHEELLQQNGIYANLYRTQFRREFLEKPD